MKKSTIFLLSILLSFSALIKAVTNVDTSIYIDGTKHELSVSVPDGFDPLNTYPLVIGLHYCGGNSKEYRTALATLCDSLDVIVACPRNGDQMTGPDFILTTIDTARSMYNIDTSLIYATGMSCNGFYLLQQGLSDVYPFKGIFPWAPYFATFTSNTFNLDSKMPTVISIGNMDENYTTVVRLYDSLVAHGANVNFEPVLGVAHTLYFPDFTKAMIRSIYYLNDTNSITIDTIPEITIINTEPPVDVKVKITHETGNDLSVRVITGNYLLASNPAVITEVGNDTVTIRITPNGANRDGKFFMVVEASEVGGTAIEQRIFRIDMQDPQISNIYENSNNSIEIFPVPANDFVYVNCAEQNIAVRIYDLNGATVFSDNNIDASLPVNISGLSNGMYLMNVKNNKTNQTFRLIKE